MTREIIGAVLAAHLITGAFLHGLWRLRRSDGDLWGYAYTLGAIGMALLLGLPTGSGSPPAPEPPAALSPAAPPTGE